MDVSDLKAQIRSCELCKDRFSTTKTAHVPRPVAWFHEDARLLIAGQAPGLRVHEIGEPFRDRSGDRLREWMGIDNDTFYDKSRLAIVPMSFCFPGYNATGSDLPPPPICARTWRSQVMDRLPNIRLTLLIGTYAQTWHLGQRMGVTQRVQNWRDHLPDAIPLPHPSWRNTGWLKKNPWFENELLPVLRDRVATVLA